MTKTKLFRHLKCVNDKILGAGDINSPDKAEVKQAAGDTSAPEVSVVRFIFTSLRICVVNEIDAALTLAYSTIA